MSAPKQSLTTLLQTRSSEEVAQILRHVLSGHPDGELTRDQAMACMSIAIGQWFATGGSRSRLLAMVAEIYDTLGPGALRS